jgi:hypothetical protein
VASPQDVRGALYYIRLLLDWLRCFALLYILEFANWYVEMGLKMYSGFSFASWLVCEPSIFFEVFKASAHDL